MPGIKSDKQFEAENDLRTMVEAGRIKKSSARMKAMKTEAKKQRDALKAIK